MYNRELVNLYFNREKKRALTVLKKIKKYKKMTNGMQYRVPLTA